MALSKQLQSNNTQPGPVTAKPDGAPALPHEPDVTPGSVDVVGVLPVDVHADPEITEGHRYDESGGSKIKPPKSTGGGLPR
jgi:hypothetical protein